MEMEENGCEIVYCVKFCCVFACWNKTQQLNILRKTYTAR